MKIIKMEQRKNEERYFDCILDSDGNERFPVNERIFIDGVKYVVRYSKEILGSGFPKKFEVVLYQPEKLTFYNYDHINFLHVFRINRISATRIQIKMSNGHSSEMGFMDAEACLNDYVVLQRLWRENASGFKSNRLE